MVHTYTHIHTLILPAAGVMVGKDSPEIVVTTLLLVVKHSTALCVVTGPELKTILSLAVVMQLLGSDTTSIHSMLGDFTTGVVSNFVVKQLTVTVEDEDDKTVALWLDEAIVMNHECRSITSNTNCIAPYVVWLQVRI